MVFLGRFYRLCCTRVGVYVVLCCVCCVYVVLCCVCTCVTYCAYVFVCLYCTCVCANVGDDDDVHDDDVHDDVKGDNDIELKKEADSPTALGIMKSTGNMSVGNPIVM